MPRPLIEDDRTPNEVCKVLEWLSSNEAPVLVLDEFDRLPMSDATVVAMQAVKR